jgi:hypothetical protein
MTMLILSGSMASQNVQEPELCGHHRVTAGNVGKMMSIPDD